MNIIRKYSLVRYAIAGFAALSVELGVLFALQAWFGLGPVASVAISFWFGLLVSFTMQKFFAFQNEDTNKRTVAKQVIGYGALVGFNYVFTLATVALLDALVGTYIARCIALAVTVVWNYLIFKRILFKTSPGRSSGD